MLHYLLRLRDLARLPLLAPLLTLLLLRLRLRFLRLTGEGLGDSEELSALALGFTSLSESLESEAAAFALLLASFLGLASLSESLTGAGLLLLAGLLLSLGAGELTFAGAAFLSFGPASSESESDAGLSDLTLTSGSDFLTALLLLSLSDLPLPLSLLSFLAFLSSAGFFRSLLAALDLSERRSLLRLRGEGEGVRRLLGGLRLLSLLSRSRCRSDKGLLARLEGEDLLGLDLHIDHDLCLHWLHCLMQSKQKEVRALIEACTLTSTYALAVSHLLRPVHVCMMACCVECA